MIYLIAFLASIFLLIALAHKWELEKNMVIPWSILMGCLACLTLFLLNQLSNTNFSQAIKVIVTTLPTIFISTIAILLLFFRDPERTPPKQDGVIVSPADGTIKYVKEVKNGEFPFALKGKRRVPLSEFTDGEIIKDRCMQIGIGMSLMDVHVNRSPINGTISLLKRIPGKFKSLKKISSLLENERAVAVIEGEKIQIGLVLIASRLVRRISFYLKECEQAHIGQRIGMIRFGSQVDVLIPMTKSLEINIRLGDKVKAGTSILATH